MKLPDGMCLWLGAAQLWEWEWEWEWEEGYCI